MTKDLDIHDIALSNSQANNHLQNLIFVNTHKQHNQNHKENQQQWLMQY
ncbi:MAG: hypothetical protein V7K47_28845 [Nostoc sp.]